MREPRIAGDTTLGYINALQIEKITPEGSSPYRSSILLKGGLTIPCLNTFTTLQMRCLQGKEIREEYLRRQAKTAVPTGAAIPGITSEMKNGIIPVNYLPADRQASI